MALFTWALTAINQGVAFNTLEDAILNGIFTPTGTTVPSSEQVIEKDQVSTYIKNYDTSNVYLSPKPTNESVEKRDLVSTVSATGVVMKIQSLGEVVINGWVDAPTACASGAGGLDFTVYTVGGTISNGTILYQTATGGGFTFYNFDLTVFYYYGGSSFYVTYNGDYTYTVAGMTSCSTPTYDYYTADIYPCTSCVMSGSTTVAVAHGSTIIVGKYYAALTPDVNSYKITGSTSATISVIINPTAFNTCALACSV